MSDALIIVGASARSAAWSALRAHFFPACVDLYGDVDLAARGPVRVARALGSGMVRLAAQLPAGPWLYAGGVENRPPLVEQLSRERRLLGNGAEVLHAVRDPWQVQRALTAHGLLSPALAHDAREVPSDGSWLCKHRDGSGGAHVARWRGIDAEPRRTTSRRRYWQQFISGTSQAGLFVAAGGKSQLLGVTQQLLTSRVGDDAQFVYSGSIGPLPLDVTAQAAWSCIGAALASRFGLVGLFGVDAVVNDHGIWSVEVNPRYTASAEMWDLATGRSAIGVHVAACIAGDLPLDWPPPQTVFGKRIVYADRRFQVSRRWSEHTLAYSATDGFTRWVDIPRPRITIHPGQPILTVLAAGPEVTTVVGRLGLEESTVRESLAVKRHDVKPSALPTNGSDAIAPPPVAASNACRPMRARDRRGLPGPQSRA